MQRQRDAERRRRPPRPAAAASRSGRTPRSAPCSATSRWIRASSDSLPSDCASPADAARRRAPWPGRTEGRRATAATATIASTTTMISSGRAGPQPRADRGAERVAQARRAGDEAERRPCRRARRSGARAAGRRGTGSGSRSSAAQGRVGPQREHHRRGRPCAWRGARPACSSATARLARPRPRRSRPAGAAAAPAPCRRTKTTNAARSDHCGPISDSPPPIAAASRAGDDPGQRDPGVGLDQGDARRQQPRHGRRCGSPPYALEQTRQPNAAGYSERSRRRPTAPAMHPAPGSSARASMVAAIAYRRPCRTRSSSGPITGAISANGAIVTSRYSATRPRASPTGTEKNRVLASATAIMRVAGGVDAVQLDQPARPDSPAPCAWVSPADPAVAAPAAASPGGATATLRPCRAGPRESPLTPGSPRSTPALVGRRCPSCRRFAFGSREQNLAR